MTIVPSDLLERRVRVAARALARHGLVQAWGHCSARLDDRHFLVCASQPMACIAPGETGTVVPIAGPLPEGVLGEVRIHQQIYAHRQEVGGVCRVMPPMTMALSTLRLLPRPRHGVGAYLADCAFWDDPSLLRDDVRAQALAVTLGQSSALVMRGNGAVTVGPRLEHAMGLAWCLEDAARVEHAVRALATDPTTSLLAPDEVLARQVVSGRVFERLWQHMSHGDAETLSVNEAFGTP